MPEIQVRKRERARKETVQRSRLKVDQLIELLDITVKRYTEMREETNNQVKKIYPDMREIGKFKLLDPAKINAIAEALEKRFPELKTQTEVHKARQYYFTTLLINLAYTSERTVKNRNEEFPNPRLPLQLNKNQPRDWNFVVGISPSASTSPNLSKPEPVPQPQTQTSIHHLAPINQPFSSPDPLPSSQHLPPTTSLYSSNPTTTQPFPYPQPSSNQHLAPLIPISQSLPLPNLSHHHLPSLIAINRPPLLPQPSHHQHHPVLPSLNSSSYLTDCSSLPPPPQQRSINQQAHEPRDWNSVVGISSAPFGK